jgi:hypothetical protein
MRKVAIIAAAALLAWATPAPAADKGGPPATLEQIIAASPSALRGCYVEAGLAGTFLAAGDRTANGALGGGCNLKIDRAFIGANIRGFFGEDQTRGGSLGARLGFALNPNVDLYGLVDWRAPDFKLGSVGQLYVGAGLETTLFVEGLSGFVEASTAVSKWGAGTSRDDVATIIGLRWRFR